MPVARYSRVVRSMSPSRRRSRPEANPQRIVLAAERRSPEVLLVTAQMTIRLGSMQIVGMGLLFAALKLT